MNLVINKKEGRSEDYTLLDHLRRRDLIESEVSQNRRLSFDESIGDGYFSDDKLWDGSGKIDFYLISGGSCFL